VKLFLISQTENNDWDTWDAVVVCAESEDAARLIHPNHCREWGDSFSGWCSSPDLVTVEYIGEASDDLLPGVVLGSFNAG